MKQFLLILIVFICIGGCNDGKVYICNGPQSKAYHRTKSCQGLRRCTTDIESVNVEKATGGLHRRKCGYCY